MPKPKNPGKPRKVRKVSKTRKAKKTRTSNGIPITVLCGFLGSGKTTLLRRWQTDPALSDAAFIIHDLSEFGVDVEILAKEDSDPKPGRLVDRLAALHGKHARELLIESVGHTLKEIADLDPAATQVLCESTGAARPWPLIAALTQDDRFHLRHFVVTVDALNLHRDFSDGRVLTGEATVGGDPALQQAAGILAEQLLFASVIILTKVDTVPRSVTDAQVRILQKLRPGTTIGLSALGGLQLPQLRGTPAPDPADLQHRAELFGLTLNTPTANEVEAMVIRDPRPFHPQRLYDVCQNRLGTGIYRTKGFLWLASRPGDVLLWQQSGSQISFEHTSFWAAETLKDDMLLPDEIEVIKARVDAIHPIFGDRRTALTIIGLPDACNAFAEELQQAFCTDEEIEDWQSGATFADPWPKSVRKVE